MVADASRGERDCSLGMLAGNLVAAPLAALLGGGIVAAHLVAHGGLGPSFAPLPWLAVALLFLAGVAVHELLHAAGFVLGGAAPATVRIRVHWPTLTPYATCSTLVSPRAYRVAGALPGVALGLVPAVVGVALGQGALTVWGALFTGLAAGDFVVLWLIRDLPADALVQDHPARLGCRVVPRPAGEGPETPPPGDAPALGGHLG